MSEFDILFQMPTGGRNTDDMGTPPATQNFHDPIFLKNGTQTSLKTLQIYLMQNGDWPRRMMPITRDEPHPPDRLCPCKDCLPSFEDVPNVELTGEARRAESRERSERG